jgi:hypothetical protein
MTATQGFAFGVVVAGVGGFMFATVKAMDHLRDAANLQVDAEKKLEKAEAYFDFVKWFANNVDNMNEDAFYARMRERMEFTDIVVS